MMEKAQLGLSFTNVGILLWTHGRRMHSHIRTDKTNEKIQTNSCASVTMTLIPPNNYVFTFSTLTKNLVNLNSKGKSVNMCLIFRGSSKAIDKVRRRPITQANSDSLIAI